MPLLQHLFNHDRMLSNAGTTTCSNQQCSGQGLTCLLGVCIISVPSRRFMVSAAASTQHRGRTCSPTTQYSQLSLPLL